MTESPLPIAVPTLCEACGAEDTLPKHHVTILDPEAWPDGMRAVSRHFRCCIEAGCPDGTCQALAQ